MKNLEKKIQLQDETIKRLVREKEELKNTINELSQQIAEIEIAPKTDDERVTLVLGNLMEIRDEYLRYLEEVKEIKKHYEEMCTELKMIKSNYKKDTSDALKYVNKSERKRKWH